MKSTTTSRDVSKVSKLDPTAGVRCTPPGIKLVTVNLNTITVGQPLELYKGGAYGFSVVSISALSTYITNGQTFKIKFARLRQKIASGTMSYSNDDEAVTVTPGLVWIPTGEEMAFDELWGVLSGSNQAVTITIAVALRPGALVGALPVISVDPNGAVMELYNADADADFSYTLKGPVTNARNAVWNAAAGDWARQDGSNADADADFAASKVGAVTNTRIAGWVSGATDWQRVYVQVPSSAHGTAHNSQNALWTLAGMFGRDTSDNTMRAPEVRTPGAAQSQATTIYRLSTDSVLRAYDAGQSAAMIQLSASAEANNANGFLLTAHGRESGFYTCQRGRRFRVTTEGAAVTVTNGFVATTPRFTLEAGATSELIIRRIKFKCLVAGTTNLQYRIILDPDARYSSGGTTGTVGARVNMNGGSSATVGFTFHYGAITATAADADEREVEYGTIVNVTGEGEEPYLGDGLVVPASGTLLIYLMDAGAVGTVTVLIEGEEVNFQ